jgi:hypothetical protein
MPEDKNSIKKCLIKSTNCHWYFETNASKNQERKKAYWKNSASFFLNTRKIIAKDEKVLSHKKRYLQLLHYK